jgi:rubredoxin
MGIFSKNKNPGAFGGSLSCPVCYSLALRFVEDVGPHVKRYRCRKCGLAFRYEYASNPYNHPYASFNKTKWQGITERGLTPQQLLQGRKI